MGLAGPPFPSFSFSGWGEVTGWRRVLPAAASRRVRVPAFVTGIRSAAPGEGCVDWTVPLQSAKIREEQQRSKKLHTHLVLSSLGPGGTQSPGISIPSLPSAFEWVSSLACDLLRLLPSYSGVPLSLSREKPIKGTLVPPCSVLPFHSVHSIRTTLVLVNKHFFPFSPSLIVSFLLSSFTLLTLVGKQHTCFSLSSRSQSSSFPCRPSFWTKQSRLFVRLFLHLPRCAVGVYQEILFDIFLVEDRSLQCSHTPIVESTPASVLPGEVTTTNISASRPVLSPSFISKHTVNRDTHLFTRKHQNSH